MRLLFITNNFPNPLQPTRALFNFYLARALAQAGSVRVIAPIAWRDEWHERANQELMPAERVVLRDGLEIHHPRYVYPPGILRSQYGHFFGWSIRAALRRVLDSFNPQVVLGYWAHPDGEAAIRIAHALGVPGAVIVGGSDVLLLTRRPARRRRIARTLIAADAVIALSRQLKDKVVELGVNPAKVHLHVQGIDKQIFFPGNQAAARHRLGIEADRPVLLWVGRMVPVKAVDVLLEACRILRSRGQAFQFNLVGDGPLRASLELDCRRMGLEDCVRFVGPQGHDALPDWYRAADLTVLSSLSEGMPNVLRESLVCGTPFVATAVGGIDQIADDPRQLARPGDAEALAEAIARRLNDPQKVDARRMPSWADSAENLLGILRPLMETARNSMPYRRAA